MARYHLEDMRELTFSHTKEHLKLDEQRIKDKITQSGETVNGAGEKSKGKELWQTWSHQGKVLQMVSNWQEKKVYKCHGPNLPQISHD